MSFYISVHNNGKVKIRKGKDESLCSIVGKTASALGSLVFEHFKDAKDPNNYEALVEISENVIIPSFLEGAGCRKKE